MIDLDAIQSRLDRGVESLTDTYDLLREVKRLRAEADKERAAVVTWLREEANAPHPIEAGERALSPSGRGLLLLAAIRIERGEHRREGEE